MKTKMGNEELKIGIGTEEQQQLKPVVVKVVAVNVEEVTTKDKKVSKKVVCMARHPDREDSVSISGVKYERKGGKLAVTGTWLNLDSKGLIQKGSALAALMIKLDIATPQGLLDKEIETTTDEQGYLVFKAY